MRTALRRALVGLAVFGTALAFSLAPDSSAADTPSGPRLVTGVLRQDSPGAGWYLLGGAHAPVNLAVRYTDHNQIELLIPSTTHILSFVCAPDEAYAQLGYECGVSAKLDYIDVKIGRGGVAQDPLEVTGGQWANFWILGWVE